MALYTIVCADSEQTYPVISPASCFRLKTSSEPDKAAAPCFQAIHSPPNRVPPSSPVSLLRPGLNHHQSQWSPRDPGAPSFPASPESGVPELWGAPGHTASSCDLGSSISATNTCRIPGMAPSAISPNTSVLTGTSRHPSTSNPCARKHSSSTASNPRLPHRQKHHPNPKLPLRRQLHPGRLQQQRSRDARQPHPRHPSSCHLAAVAPTMRQPPQLLERLRHNLMRRHTARRRHKPHTTRVMVETRIHQLPLRIHRRSVAKGDTIHSSPAIRRKSSEMRTILHYTSQSHQRIEPVPQFVIPAGNLRLSL